MMRDFERMEGMQLNLPIMDPNGPHQFLTESR